MHHTSKRQGHTPHLWVILLTILALAALYLVDAFAARWSPVEASSALEPTFSPPGGTYDRDVQLKIQAPSLGERVIFTVDGRVPTLASGAVYTRPIRLSTATPAVTVIRARAVLPGGQLGPVISASYFVGLSATLPMMSLIVDPADLWDPERGIYANPFPRGEAWERPVDVTYVDKDRRSGFHVPAGVRIHGRWSRSLDKKSLRLYFRQEYGVSRLEYPLFAGSPVQSFKRLVLHNCGQDWHAFPHTNWTLMRNQLADRLALQVDGYATHSQPALLFINGEPWGIYQIRERIDRHFLADHYGVAAADYLESPEFVGERDVVMGDSEDWDQLLQFVAVHDLADPAHYAYVQSRVDLANFIDYNILQIYAANTDWPAHNVHQFRPRVQGGRWHWMFWDSDFGFGAYLHSEVDSNLIGRVLDRVLPETGGRDTLLLRKLLENPAFRERFLARAADLLNTTLAPQAVVAHIDALAAELAPDIDYETVRWSSSVDWASSVEELRQFARHRPDFVRQHVVERLGLEGTARLTFDRPAGGSGSVAVNGLLLEELPWQGIYFEGVPVEVMAAPAAGYRFAGWEPAGLPQGAVITLTVERAQTVRPRFEPLGAGVPGPGDVVFTGWGVDGGEAGGGEWLELMVRRPGGVDLRGWRVTDNDRKTATDEGSLVFGDEAALARVPPGTTIRVVVPGAEGEGLPADDLDAWDRRVVLYAGNGHLDAGRDPGFHLGAGDNLVLLAPGPTEALGDDRGIAFAAVGGAIAGRGAAVTPASFGVLVDGVRWPAEEGGSRPSLTTAR